MTISEIFNTICQWKIKKKFSRVFQLGSFLTLILWTSSGLEIALEKEFILPNSKIIQRLQLNWKLSYCHCDWKPDYNKTKSLLDPE